MLTQILRESFNVSEKDYTDETKLMSFADWDSMAHMFFITKLEGTYEIDLNGEEIEQMQTVGEIKKVILSKGKTV
jgi:acyl carrier protein